MEKVIFLDIDGVLNSEEYFINRNKEDRLLKFPSYNLDFNKVNLLNKIIQDTNAIIVLSSSWRIYGLEKVNEALQSKGFKYKILYRTTLKNMDRGQQILEYIKENNIENYIVIDDETYDIEKYISLSKVIKTSFRNGLQDHHVKEIMDMFKNNTN